MSSKIDIETVLRQEGFYMFTGSGLSMWPLIRPGKDTLEVKPLTAVMKVGDIALYRSSDRYVAHRVIGVCNGMYLMRGDNCRELENIPEDDVLAVMTSLWRSDRRVDMDSFSYRAYKALIVRCHLPFLKFCRIISKIFKSWNTE